VPARPGDHEQVCTIIERFESSASAALARAWLGESPEHLSVIRAGGEVTGFAYRVDAPSGSTLEHGDPIVRAVLDQIARKGPLRPGERVDILRFAGARAGNRDRYALLAATVALTEWLTRPLAWSVIVAVDIEYWKPFFDYMAASPLAEADIAGLRHVAYGMDWRRLPVGDYLDLLVERGRCGGTGPPPAASLRPPPLDRPRFAAAVRAALQNLHRPDLLGRNPLMGSALAATPQGPSTGHLRTTIEKAAADLGDQPGGDRLRAVLHRTYLRPAPTQEAAAQVLDLPLSTYRRHLARALDQLTDRLWAEETGGIR
jgi:hypothetical protein